MRSAFEIKLGLPPARTVVSLSPSDVGTNKLESSSIQFFSLVMAAMNVSFALEYYWMSVGFVFYERRQVPYSHGTYVYLAFE
jgi:hypothetical protein